MTLILPANDPPAPPQARAAVAAAKKAEAAKALLAVCLRYQDFADVVVVSDARELLMDVARQGTKAGEPRPAWMKLAVPDVDVKGLKGTPEKAAARYMLVRIPTPVLDEIRRQTERRIVPATGPVIR